MTIHFKQMNYIVGFFSFLGTCHAFLSSNYKQINKDSDLILCPISRKNILCIECILEKKKPCHLKH